MITIEFEMDEYKFMRNMLILLEDEGYKCPELDKARINVKRKFNLK